MPRKAHRASAPLPVRPRKPWLGYVLTAIVAAVAGSGVTFLALRPSLTSARAAHSQTAEDARSQGNWYEDHQDWPQAITAYQKALAGGVDNPDIRTDLGVAYFKAGQLPQALEQYSLAQRQNPNHENSLYNQGAVYAELGDVPKARAVWRDYLRRFPQGQHVASARQLIAQVQANGPTSASPPHP